MDRYFYPALFAISIWWMSTGAILYVVNRAQSTYAGSLWAATGILVLGGLGIYASAGETSLAAVYGGFFSALLVWAWHEMSFLMGIVTGPCTQPASYHTRGRAPLSEAIATVIYHEFAIAITAAIIVAMTWGSENQTGTWTFLILWILRLSAKINVYLGVPNLTEDFLPAHLKYLKTFFCRRPMNMFFPVSVTATTIATMLTIAAAIDPNATLADAAAYSLLATLLALALVEHWFLVLPFDAARLWFWADQNAESSSKLEIAQNAQHATATGGSS